MRKLLKRDEGFTLIELMVVVLIIGILVAIALPTFLGARNRANDKAAQSGVRNGLAAAKTCFTDDDSYGACNAAALQAIETSLTFQDATSTDPNQVSVYAEDDTNIWLSAFSKSQQCFAAHDDSATGTTYTQWGSDGTNCEAQTDASAAGGYTSAW